jgi:DNA-binding transcriptional regulator of glucitol operon
MEFWQVALGLWAVLWAGQAAGTWLQMRHYQHVMRHVTGSWHDGFVGTGAARGWLGKGAIAIVVAGPDQTVRQVLLMEGRGVLAKFREHMAGRGTSLDALAAALGDGSRGRGQAVAGAVAQIRKVLASHATGDVGGNAGDAPVPLAA